VGLLPFWGFGKVQMALKCKRSKGIIFNSPPFEFIDVVLAVIKDMPAWPGRHLLEGGEHRRYFGLKTLQRGVVEFECMNQKEYDLWTQGVSRLLSIAAEKGNRHRV
jgi:hypothetical protein